MAARPEKTATPAPQAAEPKLDPVSFELVGSELLRLSLPGGLEAALDAGQAYATSDPAAIAALDAHPATRRLEEAN